MNNVSLQLQQYRALKAQATRDANAGAPLTRHPEKTDYFQQLMKRWEESYLNSRFMAKAGADIE